jgi:glucose/arabinose dehydrogenase
MSLDRAGNSGQEPRATRGPRFGRRGLMAVATALALGGTAPGEGQGGLQLDVVEVVTGLDRPVGFVNAGDGSGRRFIVEQSGRIRILTPGGFILADPFLNISTKVSCCGERGLLGLAFHPQYADNGAFFVNYTNLSGNTVVARYLVDDTDPNKGDPDSEEILLTVSQPFSNHNAGDIAFGPDGYLYITMGDGGSGGDPLNHGQNLGTLLGSLLRIDVDSEPDPGLAYAIPPDNPFVGNVGALDEIWAFGLRNPWRMSFDRVTGDLFIADVGQNTREEVNFQPPTSPGGENYGWKVLEGTHCHSDNPPGICNEFLTGGSTLPVLEYPNAGTTNCSVTGGYRYRGSAFPQLEGIYFFGDYCSGRIWGTVPRCDGEWEMRLLLQVGWLISSFGEDEDGEVYVVRYASGTNGRVYRLVPAPGSGGPLLSADPEALGFGSVEVGASATLELALMNSNLGPEAVFVESLELMAPESFTIDLDAGAQPCLQAPLCLSPGEWCTLEVTFEPEEEGEARGLLVGTGNTPVLEVPVTGTGVVVCPGPDTLELTDLLLDGQATFLACREILTGPDLQIVAPGQVRLVAGERVVMRDGTSVGAGATLEVEIDPSLAPQPPP